MSNASGNPYSSSRIGTSLNRQRAVPFREAVFVLTLAFITWGMLMFNHDLPVALHVTAVLSLGMTTAVFSVWGCILVTLLISDRSRTSRNVSLGVMVGECTALLSGLLMIRGGYAPHGLLLPFSVFAGAAVAFWTQWKETELPQKE